MARIQTGYYRKYSSLKNATIGFGLFSILLWGAAIGCLLGFEFPLLYGMHLKFFPSLLSAILILVNVGFIYYTSGIIFSTTGNTFPSPEDFRDIRCSCSKLLASCIVGLAVWINAVAWFSKHSEEQPYQVLFGCAFSYFFTILVFFLASSYESKISKTYFRIQRIDEEPYPMEYHPPSDPRPPAYRNEEEDRYISRRFSQQSNRSPTPGPAEVHRSSINWDLRY